MCYALCDVWVGCVVCDMCYVGVVCDMWCVVCDMWYVECASSTPKRKVYGVVVGSIKVPNFLN